MRHTGTSEILTQRLTLRKITEGDTHAMFTNWASDKVVTRYLTWQAYENEADTAQTIARWVTQYEDPAFYLWGIEFQEILIGTISVKPPDYSCIDHAELGFCIGKKWWGQGIVTEAARAVIDYLFDETGAHTCGISNSTVNTGSIRVAQKCDMRLEGTRKEYFMDHEGNWHDIYHWGITREEWQTGTSCRTTPGVTP